MATQNLVSTVLSPEQQISILGKLKSIQQELEPIVISLKEADKRSHISVGNIMIPFLEVANSTANNHPEILPTVFDKEEFNKDFALTKSLVPIANLIEEINSSIQTTLYAANSDTMVEGLEIYSSVLQNEDKVPGLDVVAEQMRTFFKRPRKSKTDTNKGN